MNADDTLRRIEARLEGHTDRRDEAAILALLEAAPTDVLVDVLDRIDLVALIGDLDDRTFGPDHRSALVRLLCHDRLAELPVFTRSELVLALSEGHTDALDEAGMRGVFLGTTGAALTELKNHLDVGADHHDLQHIVYSDIDEGETREAILAHIAEQAGERRGLKVLSDIDDTLYANWKDERFPAKTVYPGVLALYDELDVDGRVAFVTARPKDRSGFVEKATHDTLRSLGVREPVVIAGSFLKVHSDASIAEQKLMNFVEYEALFPEYEFVFFGDSGQGDAAFGARMRERTERVRGVFIHDVVASTPETRREWASRDVRFFDTWIGAAREVSGLGLVDDAAVGRVRERALSDFERIAFADPAQQAARRAELERDAGA